MNRLFDMDNAFFRFMEKVFDMFLLNIITLITCIPVITIGPALTALYYVSMKIVRDEEGYVIKGFFKSFKDNFLQGFIIELLAAVAIAFLAVDLNVTYHWMQDSGEILVKLLFYVLVGFAIIVAMTTIYVFPVLAKFDNPVKKTILIAMAMAMKNFPSTILMIVLYVAAAYLIKIYPIALFFAIGAVAFISSGLFRRIFDFYIKKPVETDALDESETTGDNEQ